MLQKNNFEFKEKYLKYKKKYMELKNRIDSIQKGGSYDYEYYHTLFTDPINEPKELIYIGQNLIYTRRNKLQIIDGGGIDIQELSLGPDSFPLHIFCSISRLIYVLDEYLCKVQIYDDNLVLRNEFGSKGVNDNQFQDPKSIIIKSSNGSDTVYIFDNYFIKVFTSSGDYIRKFQIDTSNISNLTDNSLNNIKGTGKMTLIRDDLYIIISHTIFKCSVDGQNFQNLFNNNNPNGIAGNSDNMFNNPTSIARFNFFHFIVTDTDNNCLKIFNVDGSFVKKITDSENIIKPISVCVGVNLVNIFIINDDTNHTIKRFVKIDDGVVDGNFGQQIAFQARAQPSAQASVQTPVQTQASVQEQLASTIDGQIKIINDNIRRIYPYPTAGGQTIKIDAISVTMNGYPKTLYNFVLSDLSGGKVFINIFDTLYRNKDKLLELNKKPYFKEYKFGTSLPSEAIDAGGVTKTIFSSISELFKSSEFPLFFYSKKENLLSLGSIEQIKSKPETPDYEIEKKNFDNSLDKFKFLGSLFGLAIKLGLQIQVDLEPFLLYQMTYDNFDDLTQENIMDIIRDYNPKLFDYPPYKCFQKDWEKDNYCKYNSEYEPNTSDTVALDTIKKIKETNQSLKPQLDAFISGFRETINIEAIGLKNRSINVLNKLIIGDTNINIIQLVNMIVLQGFNSEGEKIFMRQIILLNCARSKFEAVEEAEKKIKSDVSEEDRQKILEKVGSDEEKLYISKLVKFITGSPSIPSGGYVTYPLKIELKNLGESVCSAHTCSNLIDIDRAQFASTYKINIAPELDGTELFKTFSLPVLIREDQLSNA